MVKVNQNIRVGNVSYDFHDEYVGIVNALKTNKTFWPNKLWKTFIANDGEKAVWVQISFCLKNSQQWIAIDSLRVLRILDNKYTTKELHVYQQSDLDRGMDNLCLTDNSLYDRFALWFNVEMRRYFHDKCISCGLTKRSKSPGS